MKMVKVLGAQETILISDALNQMILQKLSTSQRSITELSRELNIPTLKLWRRMQRLTKAKLVEISGVEKVGNLEKKFYRVTALRFEMPQQFFEPKLADPNLQAAFGLYAKIQNETTTILSTFDENIPQEGNPTDFAVYALLQAFVEVSEKTTTQTSIQEMKKMLAKFNEKSISKNQTS
jgi:DNA-binding Lrp family transcriptional regulator